MISSTRALALCDPPAARARILDAIAAARGDYAAAAARLRISHRTLLRLDDDLGIRADATVLAERGGYILRVAPSRNVNA